MASTNSGTSFLLVATATLCLLTLQRASCTEFDVGERGGWSVPPPNNTEFYNHWASTKRFRVDDTIRFKYKKDSVMEVSKRDYSVCNSTRPNFFSNTGNTVYNLNRSGFFFFISGATGHCEVGQRMIVWVVAQDGSHASNSNNAYAHAHAFFSYGFLLVILALHFFHH